MPLIRHDHHFSPTVLDTFNECPLKYKFSHVLKISTLAKTYFNLGTTVHKVIEHLNNQERKAPPSKEIALETLERFWSSDAYAAKQKESGDRSARSAATIWLYICVARANLYRQRAESVEKRRKCLGTPQLIYHSAIIQNWWVYQFNRAAAFINSIKE